MSNLHVDIASVLSPWHYLIDGGHGAVYIYKVHSPWFFIESTQTIDWQRVVYPSGCLSHTSLLRRPLRDCTQSFRFHIHSANFMLQAFRLTYRLHSNSEMVLYARIWLLLVPNIKRFNYNGNSRLCNQWVWKTDNL